MGELDNYNPEGANVSYTRDVRPTRLAAPVFQSDSELAALGSGVTQVGRRQPVRVERMAQLGAEAAVSSIAVAGSGEPVPAPAPALAPTLALAPGVMIPVPGAPVVYHQAPLPTAPRVRERITIESPATGKMTLFCDGVAVSESIVVIMYSLDGQTSIYEPPVADETTPLKVVAKGQTYLCISGGWAVELNGQYLVILGRLPDPSSTLG